MEETLIITKVAAKRNTDSCYISFDNGEYVTLNIDIVMANVLIKDKKITYEELEKLKAAQRLIQIRKDAYRIITNKFRSEKQVAEKLKQKEYSSEEIKIGIEFLHKFNMLDDRLFAVNFAKQKLKSKQFGIPRMKIELRLAGVDKEIIEDVIAEVYPEDADEILNIARIAAEKKLKLIAHKPIEKQKNSLTQFLSRQGYSWGIIKQICDEINLGK